jgi:hypothetical protein
MVTHGFLLLYIEPDGDFVAVSSMKHGCKASISSKAIL